MIKTSIQRDVDCNCTCNILDRGNRANRVHVHVRATPLYIVYAWLQGLCFAMADIVNLRVHSFGSIEFLTRTPLAINAGLAMDIVNFIWVTVLLVLSCSSSQTS